MSIILGGIIEGIPESYVVPSVLQLEPCSQRNHTLKIRLLLLACSSGGKMPMIARSLAGKCTNFFVVLQGNGPAFS